MIGRGKAPDPETAEPKGFDDFDLRLGDIMRGERATMGKSLLDVQRELKIKAPYIAAIENADPSAFDTPGFIAGYVRSYARYLGLDPEWAFATFCEEGGYTVQQGLGSDKATKAKPEPKGAAPTKIPAHKRNPFTDPNVSYLPKGEAAFTGVEPRAIGSIAVLLVLVAGIGYGGWAVLQEVQKVRLAPVEQTPDVISQLDPLEGSIALDQDADVGAPQATFEALNRLYRPQALDQPVMVPRDGPIAAIDPSSTFWVDPVIDVTPPVTNTERLADQIGVPPGAIEAGQAPNLPERTNVAKVTAPLAEEVVLFAVRPSWVRVQDADGTTVFEKILDSGEEFVVPQTEAAHVLRAGNAGSVYFRVNGATFGPAGTGPAVVKNVPLNADTVVLDYEIADLDADSDLARFVAVADASAN
ncbi:MAG: RodZ domain-containing protein [Pseudomonadota bacterium]